jgi:hypothetical protein
MFFHKFNRFSRMWTERFTVNQNSLCLLYELLHTISEINAVFFSNLVLTGEVICHFLVKKITIEAIDHTFDVEFVHVHVTYAET